MYRRLVAGVAVAVLITVLTSAVLVSPGESQEEIEPQFDVSQPGEADRTIFAITVAEDGTARWTVEHRQEIPYDSDQRDEFEAFAEEFVSTETDTYENFKLRAERLTSSGANITGREMSATDFERDASYDEFNQEGVVTMSFTWNGFAEVEDDQVIVADVFAGGFAILEDQELRIERTDELQFDTVEPEPDGWEAPEDSASSEWIRWTGPQTFEDPTIRAVFVPADGNGTGSGETDDGEDSNGDTDDVDGDTDDEPNESDSGMFVPMLLALVVIIGVGGGALWYATSRTPSEVVTPDVPTEQDADEVQEAEPERTAPIPEEELLSDEDRVVKLLEDNGGRMRQVSIVEETEWSKSKVSMLLSEMEDDGDISKLRVGRENIISLSGEEPDAAGSPFENEGE